LVSSGSSSWPVESHRSAKILQIWMPVLHTADRLRLMTHHTGVNRIVGAFVMRSSNSVSSSKSRRILVIRRHRGFVCIRWTRPRASTFAKSRQFSAAFAPRCWIAVLAAVPSVFCAMTGAESTSGADAESAQPAARAPNDHDGDIMAHFSSTISSVFFLIVSVFPWNNGSLRRVAVYLSLASHDLLFQSKHHH